ncbi:hypothetical protein AB6N24_01685 [Cellulomonas sp. 179-A 4D5 NHS]|uniref:hypothetical protein n=1 Tax=Cellulomonas sp. 179-A 4D5 NHS TaxID=3142378 RepID=UPI0039A388BD
MRVARRSVALGAALLLVAVTLAATGGRRVPADVPELRDGDVWVVGISHPRGGWSVCFDDGAVAESLVTADLPTSGASATFAVGASESDVRRVLGCLNRHLTGGEVAVTTRSA